MKWAPFSLCFMLSTSAAFAQSPYPLQLPGFHLTLREDLHSKLPLGPTRPAQVLV